MTEVYGISTLVASISALRSSQKSLASDPQSNPMEGAPGLPHLSQLPNGGP